TQRSNYRLWLNGERRRGLYILFQSGRTGLFPNLEVKPTHGWKVTEEKINATCYRHRFSEDRR
ncbi:MAG TPA: hypothetical protein PK544_18775, partial [Spirochaetota bacterium]|nr:hypothetical protein [Spirochaetota bacterium]